MNRRRVNIFPFMVFAPFCARAAIPNSSRNRILQRRSEPRERLDHALKCSASKMDADICIQTESLARTYGRPALRKAFAALLADTKVA